MSRADDIRNLITHGFQADSQWFDWYFSDVFDESNAIVKEHDGKVASCLMLDRYGFKFGSSDIDMAYLSCATTDRCLRGQGLMSQLIVDALHTAKHRGGALVSLIPATGALYFYYDRFGFATVFYADEQRYTSVHNFAGDSDAVETPVTFDEFSRLEHNLPCTVRHSGRDFNRILSDFTLSGGEIVAVSCKTDTNGKAILFAEVKESAALVRQLLADTPIAAQSALAALRKRIGERMIIVDSYPGQSSHPLKSRGMTRIVDVGRLLTAVVANRPEIRQVISVNDSLIPENEGIYIIGDGKVTRTRSTDRHITLDVTVDTLARILFNSDRIGSIFGLPSMRPAMSLMLD